MPKQIATYDPDVNDFIEIGYRASVFCKTHSRPELCNRPVLTSMVESIDEVTGVFNTRNTQYVPINP